MSSPVWYGEGSEVLACGPMKLAYGIDIPYGTKGIVMAHNRSEFYDDRGNGAHFYLVKFDGIHRVVEVYGDDLRRNTERWREYCASVTKCKCDIFKLMNFCHESSCPERKSSI